MDAEAAPHSTQIEYRLALRLRPDRSREPIRFLACHRLDVGDVLALPIRLDGDLYPDESYQWRVAEVCEDGASPGALLVLTLPDSKTDLEA